MCINNNCIGIYFSLFLQISYYKYPKPVKQLFTFFWCSAYTRRMVSGLQQCLKIGNQRIAVMRCKELTPSSVGSDFSWFFHWLIAQGWRVNFFPRASLHPQPLELTVEHVCCVIPYRGHFLTINTTRQVYPVYSHLGKQKRNRVSSRDALESPVTPSRTDLLCLPASALDNY